MAVNFAPIIVTGQPLVGSEVVVDGVTCFLLAVTQSFSDQGGWTPVRSLDLNTTGHNIKALPGQVGGWYFGNTSTTTVYVKLYDQATTPLYTDTPVLTIAVPAGGANILSNVGIQFLHGIGWRATTVVADDDQTSPSTNQMVANLFYR